MESWLVGVLGLAGSIIGGCLTAGAFWGMMKTKVESQGGAINKNSDHISANRDKIEELQADTMAEARHRESMREIRQELDDIKAELRAIREQMIEKGEAEPSDFHPGGRR